MRFFSLIFLSFFSLSLFSQDYKLIYIDNSNSINFAESLIFQVNEVLKSSDSNLVLIIADKDKPVRLNKESITSDVLEKAIYTRRNRPSSNVAVTLLANSILEYIDINEGELIIDNLEINLFLDSYNFKLRDYLETIVMKTLLATRLKNSSKINNSCNVIIHLNNNKEFDLGDFINSLDLEENIKIKRY